MQNFSPLGQFINSFFKHQASKASSNIVVGGNSTINSTTSKQISSPKTSLNPQTQMQQANTQLIATKMDSAERAVLIKDLMNLPNNLNDLLATAQKNAQTAQQGALLKDSQNLNVNQLMELIQANGKEALAKLAQLTSIINKTGNVSTKELQELQFIVNACIPNANMTNTQFMKNLILLYLPWLPIGENNNFDIEFSSSSESEGSNGTDDTITILIQTENYGNVKVLVILESTNKVNISINCAKIFPKDLLLQRLKQASEEYKLQTETSVTAHEMIEKTELSQQKIHMSGASVLNPYILLMAHSVIKNVIDIDKSQTLVSTRKQAIQEK